MTIELLFLALLIYCYIELQYVIWECLKTVWNTYFSKIHRIEDRIQRAIEKKTKKKCDVAIKDNKVNVMIYEKLEKCDVATKDDKINVMVCGKIDR